MANILIVDDQQMVADLYADMLKPEHNVMVAYSGEEALEKLKLDETVEIVFLDRMMPGMSGDELLEIIRADPKLKDLYVVLVTAVKPDVDTLSMGFNDYLVKPVKGDELRASVERGAARKNYDSYLNEYFEVINKLSNVSQTVEGHILRRNPEYKRLSNRAKELKKEIDRLRDELVELTERHNRLLTV